MDKPSLIRDANLGDLDSLVATLGESFAHDPMFNWVFPHIEFYPYFFHMLVKDVYLPRGIVHVAAEGDAAALWLPPEERFQVAPRLGLLKLGLRLIHQDGLKPVWRVFRQGSVFSRHFPREPHYYLQFIGCHPSKQGQGIGTALLRQGLDVCDQHNMPAYLECSNVRNVPLYERHGFRVKGKQTVSKHGPTAWFMWRDAY